jgi:glucans biosynthesis protein C
MNSTADPTANRAAPRSSLAIDNLRAVVILLVLAFHSTLAYLNFLPQHSFAFDGAPMLWRAFPIIDTHRWIGFDLFCAWLDVFLMSFFFLLSGLFAWTSLSRKGVRAFLADRVLRLGLPFAVVVGLLMPVAEYPTYLRSVTDPSLVDYWRQWLALPLWPSGPMWFLWLLLVGDLLVAGLYQLLAGRRDALLRLSAYARRHPVRFLTGVLFGAALGYVPLALVFGTQEWFQRGPFALQLCRPLHYAVYFFAGVAIGACGIESGLVAPDGPLARQWRRWLMAAPLLFLSWVGLTALTMRQGAAASLGLQTIDNLGYVLACFVSCFMAFALAVRFAGWRWPVLASVNRNVYGMYLVHYLFVVWLQYSLLGVAWPAIPKAAIVFVGTVLASWSLSEALCHIPAVAYVIGGGRRAPAAAPRPLPSPARSPGWAGR